MYPGVEFILFMGIAIFVGGYLLISLIVNAFVSLIVPERMKKKARNVVIGFFIAIPLGFLMREIYQDT